MVEPSKHDGPRSPEYALLGFLYEKPDHGYTLYQHLTNELGQIWHVSQSQTYNILKRLEAQGYTSSTTKEQEKLPPRQILQITAAGRHRFEDWLQTPSGSSVHAIRLEFITRLYFAEKFFPRMIPEIFAAQSAEIQAALTRLELNRPSIPSDQKFNRLSLDLRIRQLRAVRDWIVKCRQTFDLNP
jgi:DNA-binding PadR family transcriptional regulator